METALPWVILASNLVVLLVLIKQNTKSSHQNKPTKPILVDSSGLIDGRILDIAKVNFINQTLIVPKAVVLELQSLADKSDPLKRERARFGLEVIQLLQNIVDVRVVEYDTRGEQEVDELLVKIAVKNNAMIYSTDYNLQQVAQIAGIAVLNINELSQALRPIALPGEIVSVKLVQKGQDKNQAVGYLDDGTMVIVNNARKQLNHKVNIRIVRALQTVSGRMMFAELVS